MSKNTKIIETRNQYCFADSFSSNSLYLFDVFNIRGALQKFFHKPLG